MAALVLALAPSPLHPRPLRLVHWQCTRFHLFLIRLAHNQSMMCADGGGALLDGTLDEAAEHAAFRQAVAAWRQGEKEAVNKGSCYQCYRLFYKVSQPRRCSRPMGASLTNADLARAFLGLEQSSSHQQFTSDSHEFCREECLQAYSVRMKELQKSKVRLAFPGDGLNWPHHHQSRIPLSLDH